jgi:hypothetical protein
MSGVGSHRPAEVKLARTSSIQSAPRMTSNAETGPEQRHRLQPTRGGWYHDRAVRAIFPYNVANRNRSGDVSGVQKMIGNGRRCHRTISNSTGKLSMRRNHGDISRWHALVCQKWARQGVRGTLFTSCKGKVQDPTDLDRICRQTFRVRPTTFVAGINNH